MTNNYITSPKKFKTKMNLVPQDVKIIKGIHKGVLGEVWDTNRGIVQIVTPNGWYITEPIENIEVYSLRKQRKIDNAYYKIPTAF